MMSAMGHFRPFNNVCVLSAFHPIATKSLHYVGGIGREARVLLHDENAMAA
jgi:hypothetical protein